MKHALAIEIVFVLFVFAGCSRADALLDGYKRGKGDLRDFIVDAAPKLGVHLLETNALPPVTGRWQYRAQPDELAVVVEGDCFPEINALLTNAIGAPQGSPRADKTTGAVETCYGTNLTATVCCRSGITDAGKQYTSLVIVSYGAAAAKQADYAQLFGKAVETANASHSALDAARPSAPYVSDFVRLFPKAEVHHVSLSSGWGFDVNVDLFDRYEFTMQLPVILDPSGSKVIDYGEPQFYLNEATNVVKRTTWYDPKGGRTFGSGEWKKIVESGGDFAAIGYTMMTNRPVQCFRNRKTAE